MEQEKSCNNCKHYCRYYVKQNIRFKAISKGHCCHDELFGKSIPELCAYWEDNAEREELRERAVKEALGDMCKKLGDILAVLSDD